MKTPVSLCVTLAFFSLPYMAQASPDTPADNTRTNKSDSHISESADASRNDKTDLSLSQRIRQSVMADKSLSTYAHNVKIVSVDGKVTLNGVVDSAGEKESVVAKAVAVAGQHNVVDRLTVAEPK